MVVIMRSGQSGKSKRIVPLDETGEFRLAKVDYEAEAAFRKNGLDQDLCHRIGTVAKTDLGRQSSSQASPEIELGK